MTYLAKFCVILFNNKKNMRISANPLVHSNASTLLSLSNSQPLKPLKRIAYTTPGGEYAERMKKVIINKGAKPLSYPSIVVETTHETNQNILETIKNKPQFHELFSAIAFTSRAGINAFVTALEEKGIPPLSSKDPQLKVTPPLSDKDPQLIVGALGKDAELLETLPVLKDFFGNYKMVVPSLSTPVALASELGHGNGRKVLCPVPMISGLDEPSVVPEFLRALGRNGWDAVRVDAYITRWAGAMCAKPLVEDGDVDGIVFTSTAEVQGLLKSLYALGIEWKEFRSRHPRTVVAAHGPVTADGAFALGVEVDVVGTRFQSFHGVVDAIMDILST